MKVRGLMLALLAGAISAHAAPGSDAGQAPPPSTTKATPEAALGASSPTAMTAQQAGAAIMEYYPAAARAAGIEGWAKIKCPDLSSCVVVSENPGGSGFGQAAVTIARRWASLPSQVPKPPASTSLPPLPPTYRFAFNLHPPAILPNPLRSMTIAYPDWANRKLGPWQMIWPAAAHRAHVSGDVVLDCDVTDEGRLDPCAVAEESPKGWGFGDAALSMALSFRMKPMLLDGQPTGGARVRIPLDYHW